MPEEGGHILYDASDLADMIGESVEGHHAGALFVVGEQQFYLVETYLDGKGQRLLGVHSPRDCEGRGCVIHHPSDHHMRDWPTEYRFDRGLMERTCVHGIGHPDPDDLYYIREFTGRSGEAEGVHGCDGCCAPPEDR